MLCVKNAKFLQIFENHCCDPIFAKFSKFWREKTRRFWQFAEKRLLRSILAKFSKSWSKNRQFFGLNINQIKTSVSGLLV
jgi:hypothetical protein